MTDAPAGRQEQRLRARFRWAAGWLLLHAGAHLPAHWRLFLHADGPPEAQRGMVEALREIPVRGPLETSLWEVIGAFSLVYAVLLALLGASGWILAREAPSAALRRHAWRHAWLLGAAALLLGLIHPLPQPLLAVGGGGLLFLWAALTRHDRSGHALHG
ncbi:LIC_13387 family protein [Pseudomarimonas salicorniae]|uniref:PepSY-associated TM region n=1 Tax=Pseudomarimonas salicorniae TaxID=2933270 RepID=A0ABT0GDA2_9GAMM|nr:hypothetical protein [Lysobacter sp. CAU 1642]MCK7592520.1 hypothetical protein [Lysobacter sp. CAU 1642]